MNHSTAASLNRGIKFFSFSLWGLFLFVITTFITFSPVPAKGAQRLAATRSSASYQIDADAFGKSGSGTSSSPSYTVYQQAGEVAAGKTESANFKVTESIDAIATSATANQGVQGAGSVLPVEAAVKAPTLSEPQVKEITDRSAIITWISSEPSTSIVRYGAASGNLTERIEDASFSIDHRLFLSRLTPRTQYFFTVGGVAQNQSETQSAIFSFQTAENSIAPSNPASFRVIPQDGAAELRWTNPREDDFAKVIIRRSETIYPSTREEGDLVFEGKEEFFVDTKVDNEKIYYYSIFSIDTSKNSSSGSIANAIPKQKPIPDLSVPPPAEVTALKKLELFPELSQEMPPTPSLQPVRIEDFDILIFTDAGPLKLTIQNLAEGVHIVRGAEMAFRLSSQKIARPIRMMALVLEGSAYLFQFNQKTNVYETIFTAPDIKGEINVTILMVYEDGAREQLEAQLTVDPKGYVYSKVGEEELRLKGARVKLYWMNPETNSYEIWQAPRYNQINPVVTDVTGEYAFMVPEGRYYVEVTYNEASVRTEEFDVHTTIVNKNIEWTQKTEAQIPGKDAVIKKAAQLKEWFNEKLTEWKGIFKMLKDRTPEMPLAAKLALGGSGLFIVIAFAIFWLIRSRMR